MEGRRIARMSPEPFCRRSARLAGGDRLPGETELCRHSDFACSSPHPSAPGWVLQETAGFFDGKAAHNRRTVDTQAIEAGRCVLPAILAAALELPTGSDGSRLRSFRRLDGELAHYSENHLPVELADLVRASEVLRPNGLLNRVPRPPR